MKKERRVIVWFRQDLRLHDNEALMNALEVSTQVIPVYVFDERTFKDKTKFGFQKTGIHRTKFILESIRNLRKNIKALGSDLIVRVGKPEEILYELARKYKTSWIFCNRERTQEEVDVQNTLEQNLWSIGQEIRFSRGKMLYYTADLPFPVSHTPDVFTTFRKEVEKIVSIRPPFDVPQSLPALPESLEPGEMPDLTTFGFSNEPEAEPRSAFPFQGGEDTAVARLKHYLWETDHIKSYKETRNGLLGTDYSSKFSPWLSQGCLSPKLIYHELKKYEEERGSNDSTYWLFFELLWRDFFRLMGKKHGNHIFFKKGTKGTIDEPLKNDMSLFRLWAEGRTGIPFIDANMRELKATGFMSNRGRQNVASFLVKDLKVNWQIGAEYFESLLLDYDPCSNYGNWNYIAGVGSDPRENRYFNILSQAKRYDPKGEYVKKWLPELAGLPTEQVHRPDTLSEKKQLEFAIKLGADYPKAMVNTAKWA